MLPVGGAFPPAEGQRVTTDPEDTSNRTSEVAVAVRQDGASRMPRIVASGRGAVAEQILAVAFAQGVKVREDADLAELLSALDVESEIPLEALAPVAAILSYVHRADGADDDAEAQP